METCETELNAFRQASLGQTGAIFGFIDQLQDRLRETQTALQETTDRVQDITSEMIEYRLTGTATRHKNYALQMENDDLKERVQHLEERLSSV